MAIEKDLLDQLLAGRDPKDVFNKDGLVDELKRALSERILNAEIDEHLDGDGGEANGNHRNGYSKKSVLTGTSKMTLSVPRDRAGTFDPQLIAKYQRRFPDFDDKIISMYARGMTVREIRGHLEELYCQIASKCDPFFASKNGSDSISMKFADGIALFSKRNQRHANQFSDFCSRPRGSDCRKRGPTRRFHPCNRSGRYPGGELSSVWIAFATRSQPVCS